MRRRLLFPPILLLAISLAAPARADDAAVSEARARFTEGVALAEAGKHDEARLKFQQAAAVLKAPPVLFNLARSEQLTGHDYEAMDHYKQFLRASANAANVTDEQRAQAKKFIQELGPRVGQIDVDAPPNSRISIDGKALDESPKEPIAVPPGRHVVEAAREGKIKSISVDCGAGSVVKAKIELDPDAPSPASDPTKWIVAGALGAAGLVGVGLGVGFAISSRNAKSESEDIRAAHPGLCTPPPTPDCARYDSRRADSESAATTSKIGYIAGTVLLVGAVTAIVIWPRESDRGANVQPMIGGGTYGAAVGGRF
jgi:hypothetical protein